jgi:hypothetical protein
MRSSAARRISLTEIFFPRGPEGVSVDSGAMITTGTAVTDLGVWERKRGVSINEKECIPLGKVAADLWLEDKGLCELD